MTINQPSDRDLFRRFVGYMSLNKPKISLAFVLLLVQAILGLLGPYIWAIAIDNHIIKRNLDGLLQVSVLYIITTILWGFTTYFMLWIMSNIGVHSIYEMRKDTFRHLQEVGLDFYDETASGQIVARVMEDIETLRGWFSGGIIFALTGLVFSIGAIIVMFTISPMLALIALSILPIMIIISIASKKYARAGWAKVRVVNGKVVEFINENILGIRISQSFAKREVNMDEFQKINQQLYDRTQRAIRIDAPLFLLYQFIAMLGTVLVYYFGGSMIIDNENGITIGILFLFITYQTAFVGHITGVLDYYSITQSAFASFERVIRLQDTEITVNQNRGGPVLECHKGNIEFQNVEFSYRNGPTILHDFNLQIDPLTTTAIVGKTGSGKSTISNILARFYSISEGKITIDGQDISTVTLSSLRNTIGIVPQEPFLFSGTIRDNLLHGIDVDDERLEEVLRLVGASFVFEMKEGLDSRVSERGAKLSLGQRQLICIARTLIADSPIVIFDEATSSIDSNTELIIQRNLSKIVKDKTAIIIAHRLSTIKIADRILVIEDGKIVEDGSFAELMGRRGKFFELYSLQLSDKV